MGVFAGQPKPTSLSTDLNIPVSSSSFTGSDGPHLDSQVLPPIDSQQNNKGHLDERHTDPNSSTSGQVSVATSSGSPQSMSSSSEKLRAANTANFGSAASIETLLAAAESNETSIETPPSDIQDKISLIINNLSAANTDTRAKECKEILDEQYYTWFAQYFVMKSTLYDNSKYISIITIELLNSRPTFSTTTFLDLPTPLFTKPLIKLLNSRPTFLTTTFLDRQSSHRFYNP
ncbi:hypothetical protein CTI12_AA220000 [Artemisia annua]|uniref:CCR4-NOT transcription complex subunit 1 CAF1-binding domain-containing protein n=1 Tax=Artemisia annua TaxID=35608 RepID=A0A2U1NWI1_ARTAN|nr:hypothetical protein CTI12_AA220000 [Artemisia annua]